MSLGNIWCPPAVFPIPGALWKIWMKTVCGDSPAVSHRLSLSESNMSKEFPNNFPYHSLFFLLTFLTFYVTCHFPMVFPRFSHISMAFLSLGQATLGIAATSEGQRPTEVGRCLLCRRQREMVRSVPPTHHLFWLVKWVWFKTISKLAGSNVIFPFSWEFHHPNWWAPSFFRG